MQKCSKASQYTVIIMGQRLKTKQKAVVISREIRVPIYHDVTSHVGTQEKS